ncbi:MAG: hypothetical protein L3J79_01335 [Candidatus Marinimicrobia bacterium]|nr:hypothetical protein [Candidatus Neomarinimicrobiota bacterium]
MNRSILSKLTAILAIVFGLITLRSGGMTLFIEETRAAAGDIVLFVLWSNFILGFAYIVAGAGIFLDKSWAKNLSLAIAGITLLTYAAFWIHITLGGSFIIKTVKVMAIRSFIWVAIAFRTVWASKTKGYN